MAGAELTVTLLPGTDPLRGSATLPDGERREFWGWLELAEIVQQVADAVAPGKDQEGVPMRRPGPW